MIGQSIIFLLCPTGEISYTLYKILLTVAVWR